MSDGAPRVFGRPQCVAVAIVLVYALIFVGFGGWLSSDVTGAQAPRESADGSTDAALTFVGSSSCAECHPKEHAAWKGSQHELAMQAANATSVLGAFDGRTFTNNGVTTTFFKKGDTYWVRTDGPDGKLADFEIAYAFGIYPLQQYLIALPGGRLQAFGIAWDARPKEEGGQRWFHLNPDPSVAPGHPLHWTGIDQNWNFQCAYCHSTNLEKNYDPSKGTFHTTWSEISVGCEACHGPASKHLAWAADSSGSKDTAVANKGFSSSFDERRGVSWSRPQAGVPPRSTPRTTKKEIEACAPCHSRREQIGDAHGTRFHDRFRTSLLEQGLYHADGQQRDEVYTYGSFLQSRMHAAGVTCSDCHDPHSQKLRAPGNAVCGQCHAEQAFDTPEHHHHDTGTKAAKCVSCHMPETTYMKVDPRHDHSIRIPRPDLTTAIGVPNACNRCHEDKSANWAAEAISAWYPAPKPGYQAFAQAFDLADRGAPGAQSAIIAVAEDEEQSAIARASAIARLENNLTPKAFDAVSHALESSEPLIREAAVRALANADPRLRIALLPALLDDDDRLVRMGAARALAGELEQHLRPEHRTRLETALNEYVAAQRFNAERPESQFNLANLYSARGQRKEATEALHRAIEIDPTFTAAYFALAESQRLQGDETRAEATLRQGLEANPRAADLVHALGLSLVRQKRKDEAVEYLSRAAKLAPGVSRYAYVAAVGLDDSGKSDEAIDLLKAALEQSPYDRQLLHLLAAFEVRSGEYASARAHAKRLLELDPANRELKQFLSTIEGLNERR